MSLEVLISNYGYAAIAVGSFLEGETIVLLGGLAAHRGYLELPWVIVCAFFGSFIGDQAYFYFGRMKGEEFLHKRPKLQAKSERLFSVLNRNQTALILCFRFLYGLRTLTPFIVGAAKISPFRFFMLNFFGAIVWAIAVGIAGYLFGHAAEAIIGDVKKYEYFLFGVLAFSGGAVWIAHFIVKRRGR